MSKVYNILLDDIKIGTTIFENADPPMGVVFGRIDFDKLAYDYKYFKDYCLRKNIRFNGDDDIKLIETLSISTLQIQDTEGRLIEGEACSISGMESDHYVLSVLGIPYPFYRQEFAQHVAAYEKRFEV